MGFTYSEFASTGYNYQIFNSLRIRQSASSYISRVPTTSGNSQKWTWSGWVKLGSLSTPNLTYIAQNTSTQATYFGRSATTYPNKFFFLSQDTAVRINGVTEAVFNDPSAWYHIVVALDTTQATAATGLKIFVNGVLQNLVSANTVWTQNTNTFMSQASLLHLMGGWPANSFYSDQLYSEVNFVDGQQLDASYFGVIDQTSGQWVAKKYSGTYGINGFYLPFNDITGTSANRLTYSEDFTNAAWAPGGGMQYTANATAAPNGATTADKLIANTTNGTHYNGQIVTASNVTQVYSVYLKAAEYIFATITVSNYATEAIGANFNLSVGTLQYTYGGGTDFTNVSAGVVPAGNGWYRCWIKYTKGTYNTYANPGIQLIDNSGSGNFAGNGVDGIYAWGAQVQSNALPGYYRATAATALSTAVNNIAADQSNGSVSTNFWTPTNISTTGFGPTLDAFKDVPSGNGQLRGTQPNSNYCVMNPLQAVATNLSYNNTRVSYTVINMNFATMYASSGKFYYEVLITAQLSQRQLVGLANELETAGTVHVGASANSWSIVVQSNASNGQTVNNNVFSSSYTTFVPGDVAMIAFDADNKKIWFGKNGTWLNSSNPSAGTGSFYTLTGTSFVPAITNTSAIGSVLDVNFGQDTFAFTPPTGFSALCTANLPISAVKKGNNYMDGTFVYGTASPQTITNASSFRPDIVWVKSMVSGGNFCFDATQGVGIYMLMNDSPTNTYTNANTLTSFNSNGFSLGSGTTGCNGGGDYEIAWQWQAGASAVTNTDGTTTTSVRANPTIGASIITYTGTGSLTTIGHGLGAVPKFIISRTTTPLAGNWQSYHAYLGATYTMFPALTNAVTNTVATWNYTQPTSSVYTVNYSGGTNAAGNTYISWVFTDVPGFSKFWGYTGNGSADGPFVYLGFRPKYVMVKRTDSTGNWVVWDSVRNPINTVNSELYYNLTSGSVTSSDVDFYANGFKIKNTGADYNASGGSYMYAAWAENPFQNANAR